MEASYALSSVVFFALVTMATAVDRCMEFFAPMKSPERLCRLENAAHSQSGVWQCAEILTMSYPFVAITAFHIPLWLLSFSWHSIRTSFEHLEERLSLCFTRNLLAGSSKCICMCKRAVQMRIYSMSWEKDQKNTPPVKMGCFLSVSSAFTRKHE